MKRKRGRSVLSIDRNTAEVEDFSSTQYERRRQRTASVDSELEREYEKYSTQQMQEKRRKMKQQMKDPTFVAGMAAESGIIRSIRMMNFMCHKHVTLDLNPHINFICGQNGSGKSAALTALTICLGAKASVTNRAGSLKSFIQNGCEKAEVIVNIKNEGDGAYLPELYGDTISVKRIIHQNRNEFKICDYRDRTISTKRADLDEITDHFALQIDNPMNVLSQDNAREFIGTASPHVKYKHFVKGVQLEQLDADYRLFEEKIDEISAKLEILGPSREILKRKHNVAKDRVKRVRDQDNVLERLREIRRQIAWAHVEAQENTLSEYQNLYDGSQQSTRRAEEKIVAVSEAYEAADQEFTEALQRNEAAQEVVNNITNEKEESDRKREQFKQEVHVSVKDQRRMRSEISNHRKTVETQEKKVDTEKRRLDELSGGGLGRRRQELEEAKEAAVQARERYNSHEQALGRLKQSAQLLEKAAEEAGVRSEAKRAERDKYQQELQNLSRARQQQDTVFHPQMPQLLQAISRERGFTARPVGPTGKHVRLRNPEWSSILESTFGGGLRTFIVTSDRDRKLLESIMKRSGCSCPIIMMPDTRKLDLTGKVPDGKYLTVLTALDFDNDLVEKQLIIQYGIEKVVLIADQVEATNILYNERPANMTKCYSINRRSRGAGYLLSYTRSGDASQDPIRAWPREPRMRTDIEAQLAIRQEAVEEARQAFREAESAKAVADTNMANSIKAVTVAKQRREDLKVAFQNADDRIDRLQQEIDRDNVEGGTLAALEAGLAKAKNDLDLTSNLYEESVPVHDAAKQKFNDATRDLEELTRRVEEAEDQHRQLGDSAKKLSQKRATALGIKNEAIAKVGDCEKDVERAAAALEEQQKQLEEFIAQATPISGRVNVPEGQTADSLSALFNKLQSDMRNFEREMGATREEIVAAEKAARAAFTTAHTQYKTSETFCLSLIRSCAERRTRWKLFRSFISSRARNQFGFLLSERSFRGEIKLNHMERSLVVQVEPDITRRDAAGRQANTLSGGEKSFTQICLLLAIWEAMGSPIRCLDEFDVFMDSVNRKLSVDLLVGAARQSPGRQFLFISPGTVADIGEKRKDPDVKAIR